MIAAFLKQLPPQRGYPHLSLKMDYRRDNVLARHIMTTDVVKLPAQAATLNMLGESRAIIYAFCLGG